MSKYKKIKRKVNNYLYDHVVLKKILKNTYMVLITILSAVIFSFGFKCFISPNYTLFPDDLINDVTIRQLASSGSSGITQCFVSILKLCGLKWLEDGEHQYIVNFIGYFIVNVPLLIFAYFKIGKKFAIYTLLNVGLVSLFGIILPTSSVDDFINEVAISIFDEPVARVLFAGTTTGLSSALAYHINTSAGGIDIIAYYISEKKRASVGKFTAFINFFVVLLFSILSCIPGGIVGNAGSGGVNGNNIEAVSASDAFIIFLFTVVYMIVTTLVVDTINSRNKKENIEIVTKDEDLSQVIMSTIPHACTIVDAKGGYSGEKTYIIFMTVSKKETKKVVSIARKADPNCFINVLTTEQVYGKFYRKPIE